ncbi:DUF6434 domain-containing protein [Streptomyces sp. NBC_00239]|uniref:DUF6434 domain-containing protein n=1 Tax=Streptomyces sp. NBC_00239 TaxID=2903640 RepID=UPI002E2A26AE|nr:DUF6434 domain-containing protein [Streptomyces sp. NBC_00239]
MCSNFCDETRPELSAALSGDELARWYWTLAELTGLARELGVPRGGGKAALTERLRAALDGAVPPAVPPRTRSAGRQLAAPVNGSTVIPEGQRCSQTLREYFCREIGPNFHFDSYMRTFVADGAGRTLADAVAHWHATRQAAAQLQEIGSQFELNRFLRDWHAEHPAGSRTEAFAAWRAHRDRPRSRAAG